MVDGITSALWSTPPTPVLLLLLLGGRERPPMAKSHSPTGLRRLVVTSPTPSSTMPRPTQLDRWCDISSLGSPFRVGAPPRQQEAVVPWEGTTPDDPETFSVVISPPPLFLRVPPLLLLAPRWTGRPGSKFPMDGAGCHYARSGLPSQRC